MPLTRPVAVVGQWGDDHEGVCMSTIVPTLSSVGWVTQLAEKADRLFAYYMTSEFSQSTLCYGHVTSLTYHIQQYGNDAILLKKRVEEDLTQYLSRYFDNLDLEVTTHLPDPDDPERINLRVSVVVYEKGKSYSLGREILSVKSQVERVINLNKGETLF